jgi:hypothetical protein
MKVIVLGAIIVGGNRGLTGRAGALPRQSIVRIRRRPHDWHTRVGAAGSMMAMREGQAAC